MPRFARFLRNLYTACFSVLLAFFIINPSWADDCVAGQYLDTDDGQCYSCPENYTSDVGAQGEGGCYIDWTCPTEPENCPENATCNYIDLEHLSGKSYFGDTTPHCEINAVCNAGYVSNNGACTEQEYPIQYIIDGGDFLGTLNQSNIPHTYTVSSVIDLSGIAASRPGYTFEGWYDNPTFEGSAITSLSNLTPEGNKITLYAKFEPVVCTVVYDNEDNITQEEYSGQSAINLPVLRKNSYTFDGWCEEDLDTCPGGPKQTLIARNGTVNLYAKYTKIVCEDGQYLRYNQCVSCPAEYPYSNGRTATDVSRCYRNRNCENTPTCPQNATDCELAVESPVLERYGFAEPYCKETFACAPGYNAQNNLLSGFDTGEASIKMSYLNMSGSGGGNTDIFQTPGTWYNEFVYGSVSGRALCSNKQGADYQNFQWDTDNPGLKATEAELKAAGEGQYCWCQISGFSRENSYTQNMSGAWIMLKNLASANGCYNNCSRYCAIAISGVGQTTSGLEFDNIIKYRAALYDSSSVVQGISATSNAQDQTWSVIFPYGEVSGVSLCSPYGEKASFAGDPIVFDAPEPETPDQVQYCWCKATNIDPKDDSYVYMLTGAWNNVHGMTGCNASCAEDCANIMKNRWASRAVTFRVWKKDQACVPEQYYIIYNNIDIADITWPENPVKPSVYDALTDTFTISNPRSKRYGFYGWCDNAEDASNPASECPSVVTITKGSAGNKVFYAKWGIKNYTITYMDGNNPLPLLAPKSYTENDLPLYLPTPYSADENLVFDGWYNNPELNGDAVTEIPVDAQVTNKIFYTKWRPKYYAITYMDGDTNVTESMPLIETTTSNGEDITLEELPEENGMAFVGWCDDAQGNNCSMTKRLYADTPVTLYAQREEATYHITYKNGDTDITNDVAPEFRTYTVNNPIVLPGANDVSVEHYVFNNWLDEQDTVINTLPSQTVPNGDCVLQGNFSPVQYTLSFTEDSISNMPAFSVTYDIDENLPNLDARTPTNPEYVFVGYKDAVSGEIISAITAENVGNIELTPEYSYVSCDTGFKTRTSNSAVWDTARNGILNNYYVTHPTANGSMSAVYKRKPSSNYTLPTAPTSGSNAAAIWVTLFDKGQSNHAEIYAMGEASCNSIAGIGYETGSVMLSSSRPSNDMNNIASTGNYCWCRLTSYKPDNQIVSVQDTDWIYLKEFSSAENCASQGNQYGSQSCAAKCSEAVRTNAFFRSQIFDDLGICAVGIYDIRYRLNGGNWAQSDSINCAENEYFDDNSNECKPCANGENSSGHSNYCIPVETSMNYHDINLPQPVRTGYTFDGWCADADLTMNCETAKVIQTGTTNDVYVYAKWTPIDYHITYNLDGGTLPSDVSNPTVYHIDDTIELPIPTKTDYIFDGWYECANYECNKVSVWGPDETDADKQFWAKWNIDSYTITYDRHGGVFGANVADTQTYTVIDTSNGNNLTLLQPTRQGYTFVGWCLEEETPYQECDTEEIITNESTSGWSGDKKLHAKWNLEDYTITYYDNSNPMTLENTEWEDNSTVINEYNVSSKYTYPIQLPTPLKSGRRFENWYSTINLDNDPDNSTPISEIAFGTTGNKDFYAKWACLAGNYVNDTNSCAACPTGSYSDRENVQGCELCANGKTSVEGASACEDCPNANDGVESWQTIEWENNEHTAVSNQCKIDSCKTGYEKTSVLQTGVNGIISYARGWRSGFGHDGERCRYTRTEDSTSACSKPEYADLGLYKWKAKFPYGWFYGSSMCSAKKPDGWTALQPGIYENSSNWTATEEQLNAAGDGQYCWCKIDSFTPLGGTKQLTPDAPWIHTEDEHTVQSCNDICSAWCGSRLEYVDYYRTEMFNATFDQDIIDTFDASFADNFCALSKYNIIYHNDDMNGVVWPENKMYPEFYTIEDTLLDISNPSREGFEFLGWCQDNENCDTPTKDYVIDIAQINMGDTINMYAKWACMAGYYGDGTTCTICEAGTYSDTTNAANCTVCPLGYTSAAGATSCVACTNTEHVTEWADSLCGISQCDTGYKIETSQINTISTDENGIHMHYTMHAIEHAQNNNIGCYKDGVYNDCNDSVFDNVSKPHGWRVVFRYGTVTGTSVCSTTGSALNVANANQDIYDINTPDTTSEDGTYCWCKALDYDNQSLAGSWVFATDFSGAHATCENSCAMNCTGKVYRNSAFREVMFGNTYLNNVTLDTLTFDEPLDKAMCVPKVFPIVYHNVDNVVWNNGENHPDFYTSLQNGVTVGRPTRQGFVFMGWCETENCVDETPQNNYSFIPNNKAEGQIDLYAQWTCDTGYDKDENSCVLHTYHISYIDTIDNSSVTEDYTVEQLPIEKTVSPTDTHTGRTFVGWCENEADIDNTEATCSATITVNEVGDKTFYSRWNVNTYDIEYHNDDMDDVVWPENQIHPEFYTIEDTLLDISNPSREGFEFLGWCQDNENCDTPSKDYVIDIAQINMGDTINMYAKWGCVAGYYGDGTTCEQCPTETYPNSVEDDNATLEKCFVTCNAVENCPQSNVSVCHDTDYKEYYNANSTETCSSGVVCNDYYELNNGDCVATEYTVKFMDGDTLLHQELYTVETETNDGNINITHNPENNDATRAFYQWCEKENGEYTNCVNGTTVTVNTNAPRDITFYVKWTCDNGYYSADGICTQCPIGYRNTDAGADKITDCYNIYTCPTTCPPHAHNCENVGPETITVHYAAPNSVSFESVCNMDMECDDGYELKPRKDVDDNFSGIYKLLNGQVIQRAENITDGFDTIYNDQPNLLGDASLLDNGQSEWNMDYGTLRYESTCGTASSSDSTINGEDGRYCWCKMTQYSADGINFVNMDMPWYRYDIQHPNREDCLESCFCRPFSGSNLFWFGEDKVCAAKTYSIHFNPRGGYMDLIGNNVNDYYTTAYDITAEPFYLPKPSRPGYAFAGWCETLADAEDDNSNCPTDVRITPSGSDSAEKWYYAKWTPFVCDGDKIIATDFDTTKDMLNYSFIETDGVFRADTSINKGLAPETYNLTQDGTWAAEYDYGTIYGEAVCKDAYYRKGYSLSTLVPDDVFNTFPDIYNATENDANHGGTCFCKITGFKSKFADTLQPVSGGWRTLLRTDAYGCKISCAYSCARDAKGLFAENANQNYCAYRINYHLNDGEFVAPALHPDHYDTGDRFTIGQPVRRGYKFAGWCVGQDRCNNTQESFEVNSSTVGAVDLYAQWTAGQYTITYNMMGGTPTYQPEQNTVGIMVYFPNAPTREGYDFAGWCPNSETCENPIKTQTWGGTTEDITMYAQWDIKTYYITYVFNNGDASVTEEQDFNEQVILRKPTKSGFTFDGYCVDTTNCNPLTLPVDNISDSWVHSAWNRDLTLYAKWTQNAATEECTSKAWLHIGEDKACLSKTPVEKPVLVIQGKHGKYYLKATKDSNLPMNKDTTKQLRIQKANDIYNVHDETVSINDTDNSSTGVQCNLSKLDTSLTGANYTQNSDGSWATTFSYGVIGGNAMCGTQCIGNKSVLNGVPDGAGKCCFCKITGYKAPAEDICLVSSAPWVQSMQLSSCTPYNCASTCSSLVKDWAGLRNSMYKE